MSFEVTNIEEFKTGKIIPVNKPYEWTSFDVVKKIKNQIGKRLRQEFDIRMKSFKVGHAGTLDPLAEGLVLVCTGKATKNISELMADEKEYRDPGTELDTGSGQQDSGSDGEETLPRIREGQGILQKERSCHRDRKSASRRDKARARHGSEG